MKVRKLLYVFLALLLLLGGVSYISFLKNKGYDKLDKSDQIIINEYNQYYIEDSQKPIWQGFNLENKTILAINKSNNKVFIINPSKKPSRIFTRKINLGDEYKIDVYQVYSFYPEVIKFEFDGNFNTIGKKYKIFGNEVYYIKYDNSSSINKKYSSLHFITFLSHESFHYYLQDNWQETMSIDESSLSDDDIVLIEQEYNILSKVQEMFVSKNVNHELLVAYTKQYADIMDQRIKSNRNYTESELQKETMEGTATYVGIKASQYTGYDFGVMYFDNRKDVMFSEVVKTIKSGELEKSFLYNRMPYESGAMLCLIMDELKVPDWQTKVNSKESEPSITLYSVINDFIHEGIG